jgi:hypothetical protein
MADLISMFDDDVLEATTELPQQCEIDGVAYACIATDLRDGGHAQDIGMFDDVEISLLLRMALFTAAGKTTPAAGKLVKYRGVVYRVNDSGPLKSVDGVTVTLNLESRSK